MYDKEDILNRLLADIPDEYDKSEGSFIYDDLASAAIEFEMDYQQQEKILEYGFAKTATGLYLDMKCEAEGIYRKQATQATGKVTISGGQGAVIKDGDKVASDTLTYSIQGNHTIADEEIDVDIICDEYGESGNAPVGAIKYFPVTLPGLNTVTNKAAITSGYDTESDEALRERYFIKAKLPATSGNKYHYRLWAKEVIGIGDAKIFPLALGPGTVKIVLVNDEKEPASSELVSAVHDYIESVRPIGATITTESAKSKSLDIHAKVILATGMVINDVQDIFSSTVKDYLRELAFNESQTYVSYAKIGTILFNTVGIMDYQDLQLNSSTNNITIDADEVVVLGSVTLEVI